MSFFYYMFVSSVASSMAVVIIALNVREAVEYVGEVRVSTLAQGLR